MTDDSESADSYADEEALIHADLDRIHLDFSDLDSILRLPDPEYVQAVELVARRLPSLQNRRFQEYISTLIGKPVPGNTKAADALLTTLESLQGPERAIYGWGFANGLFNLARLIKDVERLARLARDPSYGNGRTMMVLAIGRSKHPSALGILGQFLQSPEPGMAGLAIAGLSLLNAPAAIPLILPFRESADKDLSKHAVKVSDRLQRVADRRAAKKTGSTRSASEHVDGVPTDTSATPGADSGSPNDYSPNETTLIQADHEKIPPELPPPTRIRRLSAAEYLQAIEILCRWLTNVRDGGLQGDIASQASKPVPDRAERIDRLLTIMETLDEPQRKHYLLLEYELNKLSRYITDIERVARLARDPNYGFFGRRDLIFTIGQSKHPSALSVLGQLLHDPDPYIKHIVISALLRLDDPAAIPLILPFRQSEEAELARHATVVTDLLLRGAEARAAEKAGNKRGTAKQRGSATTSSSETADANKTNQQSNRPAESAPSKPRKQPDWYETPEWDAEAQAEFWRKLKRARRYWQAVYLKHKAWSLLKTGDPAKESTAFSLLKKVLSDYPDEYDGVTEASLALGQEYEKKNLLDQAKTCYTIAVVISNARLVGMTPIQGIYGLARIAIEQGTKDVFDTLMPQLRAIMQKLPTAQDHFECNAYLAIMYWELGDCESASLRAERALHSYIRFKNAQQTVMTSITGVDWLLPRLRRIYGDEGAL